MVLIAAVLCFPAGAEQTDDAATGIQLPQELSDLLQEQQSSVDLVQQSDASSFVNAAFKLLKKTAGEPLQILGKTLAILVLASLVRAFAPQGELSVASQVDTAVTVTVFFLVCTPLLSLLNDLEEAICQSRNFLIAYVPSFAALMAAGGQPATGLVFSGFFLSGAVLFAQFICSVFLPLMRIFLALNITAGISDEIDLSGVCELLLKLSRKCLTGLAGAFSAILCLQRISAGAADTLAQKAGKLVVGSAIPVIGHAVSDAMGTVYASLGVIKGTVGVAGICALAAIFLPVLFHCILYYLVLWLAAAAAHLTGSKHCSATFTGFANCVELYAAILSFFMVIILVATALMIGMGG